MNHTQIRRTVSTLIAVLGIIACLVGGVTSGFTPSSRASHTSSYINHVAGSNLRPQVSIEA